MNEQLSQKTKEADEFKYLFSTQNEELSIKMNEQFNQHLMEKAQLQKEKLLIKCVEKMLLKSTQGK